MAPAGTIQTEIVLFFFYMCVSHDIIKKINCDRMKRKRIKRELRGTRKTGLGNPENLAIEQGGNT